MLEINQVYCEDCLEGMKKIDDKSIDMILCDLPYGITQNKWDTIVPFDLLWGQYNRIIKTNGAILLFGQNKFTAKLMLSNEKIHRYNIIWEKTNAGGFLNAKRMPLVAHEEISVFYKKLPTYNPQMEIGKPFMRSDVTNGDGNNYGKFSRSGPRKPNDGTRYPRSVIKFSNDNHNSLHPTQKPVALFEYLIKTYTNEGNLVLDNCMGSFTTAIACINMNRNYIGFENDPKYFEIGSKRVDEHKRRLTIEIQSSLL